MEEVKITSRFFFHKKQDKLKALPIGDDLMINSLLNLPEEEIDARIAQGAGLGVGAGYSPWLSSGDLLQGNLGHLYHYSSKAKRSLTFSCEEEKSLFLLLEAHPAVIGIREHFPLERERTLRIAGEKELEHPFLGNDPQVMTTLFLLDLFDSDGHHQCAVHYAFPWLVKRSDYKSLLEIEKEYWTQLRVALNVFSEEDIFLSEKEKRETEDLTDYSLPSYVKELFD